MTFEEWFSILDEYMMDPYRKHGKEHVEDLLRECWRAAESKNKEDTPSTDLSIPMNNPDTSYLLFDTNTKKWMVGYYDTRWKAFKTSYNYLTFVEVRDISHWLPCPPTPLTNMS